VNAVANASSPRHAPKAPLKRGKTVVAHDQSQRTNKMLFLMIFNFDHLESYSQSYSLTQRERFYLWCRSFSIIPCHDKDDRDAVCSLREMYIEQARSVPRSTDPPRSR
jgi:hypothetical protein